MTLFQNPTPSMYSKLLCGTIHLNRTILIQDSVESAATFVFTLLHLQAIRYSSFHSPRYGVQMCFKGPHNFPVIASHGVNFKVVVNYTKASYYHGTQQLSKPMLILILRINVSYIKLQPTLSSH
jgi:hypothetical protein